MLDWTGGDARPPSNNLFFLFLLRLFWLLGNSRFCAFFALHLLLAFLDDLRLGRSGSSLSSSNFRSRNFFFLDRGNVRDSLMRIRSIWRSEPLIGSYCQSTIIALLRSPSRAKSKMVL